MTGRGERGSKRRWRPDRAGHVPRKPCCRSAGRTPCGGQMESPHLGIVGHGEEGRGVYPPAPSVSRLSLVKAGAKGIQRSLTSGCHPSSPGRCGTAVLCALSEVAGVSRKPSSGRKSQLLCRPLGGLGLAAGLRPLPWWAREQLCRSRPLALALGEAACADGGRDEATVGS